MVSSVTTLATRNTATLWGLVVCAGAVETQLFTIPAPFYALAWWLLCLSLLTGSCDFAVNAWSSPLFFVGVLGNSSLRVSLLCKVATSLGLVSLCCVWEGF